MFCTRMKLVLYTRNIICIILKLNSFVMKILIYLLINIRIQSNCLQVCEIRLTINHVTYFKKNVSCLYLIIKCYLRQ